MIGPNDPHSLDLNNKPINKEPLQINYSLKVLIEEGFDP